MSKRPRKARFEGETAIVIQGRRGDDAFFLVVIGLLALMLLGMLLANAKGAEAWLYGSGLLPFLGWVAIEPAWRLVDRQPLFRADAEGLALHPSVGAARLDWSQLKSIAIETEWARGFSASYLGFRLNQRRLSPIWPFWPNRLKLRIAQLGLSYREAQDLLRQLRRIRAAGEARAR